MVRAWQCTLPMINKMYIVCYGTWKWNDKHIMGDKMEKRWWRRDRTDEWQNEIGNFGQLISSTTTTTSHHDHQSPAPYNELNTNKVISTRPRGQHNHYACIYFVHFFAWTHKNFLEIPVQSNWGKFPFFTRIDWILCFYP